MFRVLTISLIIYIFNVKVILSNENVILGTDWRAQAEHGGFYQAKALGFYKDVGLNVSIKQGGPQINHSQLLIAQKIDFGMAPNSFIPLNFIAQNIPVKAVAAFFQKDPAVLIAHSEKGYEKIQDLRSAKIMISPDTRIGFWRFLRTKYNFKDSQIAPYTFNLAPFLSNKNAVQQGYLTSEPYLISKSGIKPQVFLLADAGYSSYAGIIQARTQLIEESPDIVQKFINASILGWYSFLYENPSPAFELIKSSNPDMSDELLINAHKMIKLYGLVDSGDAKLFGIGTMSLRKWKEFYTVIDKDNLYVKKIDFNKAFTDQFIGKGFGLK